MEELLLATASYFRGIIGSNRHSVRRYIGTRMYLYIYGDVEVWTHSLRPPMPEHDR